MITIIENEMSLHIYKKASNYEVNKWLKESKELNLTEQQKRDLESYELIRFSPFEFYKEKKKVSNVFFRLTLPFYFVTLVLLFALLPIAFIVTGRWGYKKITWFLTWRNRLGL